MWHYISSQGRRLVVAAGAGHRSRLQGPVRLRAMAGQDDWRWLQGVCVGGGGRPPGEAAGAGEAAIRWVAATTVLVCQCGLDGRGTRAHYGARFRARSDGALWGSRGADTAQKQVDVWLQMGCQFRVQGQRTMCARPGRGRSPVDRIRLGRRQPSRARCYARVRRRCGSEDHVSAQERPKGDASH